MISYSVWFWTFIEVNSGAISPWYIQVASMFVRINQWIESNVHTFYKTIRDDPLKSVRQLRYTLNKLLSYVRADFLSFDWNFWPSLLIFVGMSIFYIVCSLYTVWLYRNQPSHDVHLQIICTQGAYLPVFNLKFNFPTDFMILRFRTHHSHSQWDRIWNDQNFTFFTFWGRKIFFATSLCEFVPRYSLYQKIEATFF